MFATLSQRDLLRYHLMVEHTSTFEEDHDVMDLVRPDDENTKMRQRVDDQNRRLSGNFIEIPVYDHRRSSPHQLDQQEAALSKKKLKPTTETASDSVEYARRCLSSFSLDGVPRKMQRRL